MQSANTAHPTEMPLNTMCTGRASFGIFLLIAVCSAFVFVLGDDIRTP